MKKLVYIFIIMVTMLACSEPHERTAALEHAIATMRNNPDSALRILDSLKENEQEFGRHFRMLCRLHRMNALNKLDTLFRSTEEAQQLADYFDGHGTPNEKMLAHYLLGRAYYDTGESPMALRCFQNAAAMADTTDADCDYAQLSRIYGQMGNVFGKQNLFQQELKYTDMETKYAWKAKDTLNALLSIAGKGAIFTNMNMIDSAISTDEKAAFLLKKYGYTDISASTLGGTIANILTKKNFEKAKRYMNIYETLSGYFDSYGNIEPEREIYYYVKGRYYLAINQYDSAEYYFRKELRDGKDFNNQNAGAHGLALLFQQTNRPDSAAKYALYSYDMNDSCYDKSTTDKIIELQTIYNYTNSQEIAQQEKDKAALATKRLWISICVMIVIIAVAINIIIYIKREKQKQKQKYQKSVNDLVKIQMELTKTRSNETAYKEIIANMEIKVGKLTAKIKEYNKNNDSRKKSAKERLINSVEYKNIEKFVTKGQTLTDEHIEICHKLTVTYFPQFYEFISSQRLSLNKKEFNVCILTRLYIKPNSIGHLLDISSSYVSKMRSSMLYRVFGIIGKPKDFDEKIQNIE